MRVPSAVYVDATGRQAARAGHSGPTCSPGCRVRVPTRQARGTVTV